MTDLPTSMRAVWLEERQLTVREVPVPVPAEGEALVRVRLAGICGTDIELTRGYYPYTGVPGHEFVGEVAAPGDSRLLGRRVVGEINAWCGSCDRCRAGMRTHCSRRTVLGIVGRDGVFAQYAVLPQRNLLPVPDEIADEEAVFAEPVAAACEILAQVSLGKAERVLLVGAGRLGQLIAQVLATTGCRLEVVAKHPSQRRALEARGLRVVAAGDVEEAAYDVVVEATGSPTGFVVGRAAVRPRGVLVLKSTYHKPTEVDFSSLVVDEVTLIGSRCGPFDEALDLIGRREVTATGLIDAVLPLTEAIEGFEKATAPGAMKILLDPRRT